MASVSYRYMRITTVQWYTETPVVGSAEMTAMMNAVRTALDTDAGLTYTHDNMIYITVAGTGYLVCTNPTNNGSWEGLFPATPITNCLNGISNFTYVALYFPQGYSDDTPVT